MSFSTHFERLKIKNQKHNCLNTQYPEKEAFFGHMIMEILAYETCYWSLSMETQYERSTGTLSLRWVLGNVLGMLFSNAETDCTQMQYKKGRYL